jgi:hypothetical protein
MHKLYLMGHKMIPFFSLNNHAWMENQNKAWPHNGTPTGSINWRRRPSLILRTINPRKLSIGICFFFFFLFWDKSFVKNLNYSDTNARLKKKWFRCIQNDVDSDYAEDINCIAWVGKLQLKWWCINMISIEWLEVENLAIWVVWALWCSLLKLLNGSFIFF